MYIKHYDGKKTCVRSKENLSRVGDMPMLVVIRKTKKEIIQNINTMYNFKYLHNKKLAIFTLIIICFASSCTQNERSSEKEHLLVERIGVDIALYQFHYKYGTSRMGEVIKSGNLLLKAMRDPEVQMTNEEIELNVHKLTQLWQAATLTTAYVSAMNSGELSLLTSERLRRKFKEMNANQERLKHFEAVQVDYVNRELRPFLNKNIDRTNLVTNQRFDSFETTKLPSPFKYNPSELLKNREFANIVVDVLFFTERIMLPYNRLKILMNEIEEIIAEDYPDVKIEPYQPF